MEEHTNCCGCIPIRTGCQILGVLSLIGGIYYTGSSIFLLTVAGFCEDCAGSLYDLVAVMTWYGLFEGVITTIFSGMYLYAINKRNPKWMLYYMVWTCTRLAIALILTIVLIALATNNFGAVTFVFTNSLLGVLIEAYFIYVINVYRKLVLNPPPARPFYGATVVTSRIYATRQQSNAAVAQPYAVGTQPYAAGTQPYAAGTQPYAAGTQPYAAGAQPYAAGTQPYVVGVHQQGNIAAPSPYNVQTYP